MIQSIQQAPPTVTTAPLCRALGMARATVYRRRQARCRPAPALAVAPRPSHRALAPQERAVVLQTLDNPEFADKAPRQVYAALLDQGRYLCSTRTMYRILEANGQTRERRDQLRHPAYAKPELLATGPNQVWSWDITKLLGPAKWTYFYLYVILDIFSRLVVGWMVATRESSALATRLIAQSVAKQGVAPGQLTVHADRGSSMKSKPVALLLADLGVTKTHSRPHTSDDNPFSESHFKTLKYRPGFPDRFGSIQDARAFCQTFFPWYNTQHYHSGLALLTPETVHYGQARAILQARREVLLAARQAHPERFVLGQPALAEPPTAVWINPHAAKTQTEGLHTNSGRDLSQKG